ncbi:MAG: GntR family transcriptional regulator [Betaproteobacteria bacterium]|nr:GntR family transcriptional regulator [Betaproteobacteria bacterium]
MKPQNDSPAFHPIYRQIKALITQSLVAAEWKPGTMIPSELDLAKRYNVSQGTVRKAISELAEEKLLVRYQGRGTFVASHAEERVQFPFLRITPDQGELASLSATLTGLERLRADARCAQALRIKRGASVFRLIRRLALNGNDVCFEEVHLPAVLFKGLSEALVERHECMLYSMFEGAFGVRALHAHERIRAVESMGEAGRALKVALGTPLLLVERVTTTYSGIPMEWRMSYCDTRLHHYRNLIN